MGFYQQAADKLKKEFGGVSGQKETAMKTAVRDALLRFAEQDDEFAQAIAQGGSFKDCMKAVAACVGQSISDLEAYEKATRFYFPGARVRFEMHVDLIGDAAQAAPETDGGKDGLILDLADFL